MSTAQWVNRDMDLEQAVKTIKWLDGERRKDKAEIAALKEWLVELENQIGAQHKRAQELGSDLIALKTAMPRKSGIDDMLDKLRADVARQIETVERRRADSEREAEKLRAVEREGLNKSLAELRKGLEAIPELQKDRAARREERDRAVRTLREFEQKLDDYARLDEERAHSQVILEEGRRQDARRIADLQGETADLRKKIDELRPKIESLEDPIRRQEARISELLQAEGERRAQQVSFLEQQALINAERNQVWAEWQTRLDALHAEAEDFARQMESYAETHRATKKMLGDFQAVVDRVERRISEALEMQRLAEDRFRQEWAAFQADDQKRWTTHMLMRDEQWRENDRQFEKFMDRLDSVEEQFMEIHELARDISEGNQRRLQGLFTLLREWVAEGEQTFTQVR